MKKKDPEKEQKLIQEIKKIGKLTAYDLERLTGLTYGSINYIMNYLLKENRVFESFSTENGRTKRYFSIEKIESKIDDDLNITLPEKMDEKILLYYRRIENAFGYIQELKESDSLEKKKKEKLRDAWELILEGLADSYKIEKNENSLLMRLHEDLLISNEMIQFLVKNQKKR